MPAPYRLSEAAFRALGAGGGDPTTLAVLRRAQLSRHLLLLREVARAAGPEAETWYAVLCAAEQRAPRQVRAVLAYPAVGTWATGCLAALRAGDPSGRTGLGYLGALAAAAALQAGSAARVTVPVSDGALALPALGTALLPGAHSAVVDTAARTVTAGDLRVSVPADPASEGPGWHGLRRLSSDSGGLRLTVYLDDLDPYRAGPGLSPTGRLADPQAEQWRLLLDRSWRLLVDRHREHAGSLAADLRALVPVRDDGGAGGISATARHAFGAVALSLPGDPTGLAVGLVHEARHSRLNAVQYLFELVAPARGIRLYSPWRDDPRPPGGVLHGAYAYLGVTDFWRVERHTAGPAGQFAFARWRAAVADTGTALLDSGHLTRYGVRFVTAMRERARQWLAEPVPPAIVRLAEQANTDHRLRWRLRHVQVDPTALHRLAGHFSAGRAAPDTPVPARVRAAGGRQLESHDRLRLVHARLRGSAPGPGGSAGDLAYAGGDWPAAAAAYRRAVADDPDDAGAWSGLALTGGTGALGTRPELVAGVYRAVRQRGAAAPDPRALAGWLAAVRYDDTGS